MPTAILLIPLRFWTGRRRQVYRLTKKISNKPPTAEMMPASRNTLSGEASALFMARRIQPGKPRNRMPSNTSRIPKPMRKSVNAMDPTGSTPELSHP